VEARAADASASVEGGVAAYHFDLTSDLAWLREAYAHNIQSLDNICSPNAGATPSAEDYIRWLTLEVGCLPEVFMSDNENFVSTAIEGVLAMVGEADSIDLESLRAVAIACGADILPGERDVARSRWRPSGY
jgi:hypothetical protein